MSTQANVPGVSEERPGGAMLPVAGLAAGFEGMAGTVLLVGGIGNVDWGLNKGAAGLPEARVEAGWGLILGVGGMDVAPVGEALLGGDGAEPAGGFAAGMGVAVDDCVGDDASALCQLPQPHEEVWGQ